ncbi:hypothetical protein FI667_g13366, partial [Globisporangium splendens]
MKPAFVLPIVVGAIAGVSSVSAFGCKPAEITGWMGSCDSVAGGSKAKCDNRACHTALHRLVGQETIDCYASSGMGAADGLQKYKVLDDFCHGEGPDPELIPAPTTAAPATAPPATNPPSSSGPAPTTAPVPSSSSSISPSPSQTVLTATPKPQC